MRQNYIYNLKDYFQSVASKFSENIAIKFSDGRTISYKELDELSNNIAGLLIEKKVTYQDVIAIQNSKEPEGYAVIIACLKLGVIYTNFDDQNPKERLHKIFNTCCPKLIVSDKEASQNTKDIAEELNIPILDLSVSKELIWKENIQAPEINYEITGASPAYIMFTSGSTGIPKGVLIRHGNLVNFIGWAKDCYGITSADVLTNVNPIYFDNSVFDFYASIFNGAKLVAFPKEVVADAKQLIRCVDEMKCTIWFSVPSMLIYLTNLKLLNQDNMKHIRVFSFGGEGYPKTSLKILYDLYGMRAEFFNVYGPTECTCICSAYKITDKDFEDMQGLPTLGCLVPNFDYVILDDEDKATKSGELCLIGPQIGLGYYNDRERTAQSFVDNPCNAFFKEKMYRTGDIVSQKEDGNLYFIARKDNQIKHMGYRIELEEIEAAIIQMPYVLQTAVVHGKAQTGLSKIVAFIAANEVFEEKKLRDDLRKFLPDYMIPNRFEFMNQLPKNQNGKVDRIALKKQAELV